MAILHADNENFETLVFQSEKPVLLDFFASWCGPCKMLGKVLEDMESSEEYAIVKVDVDENPKLAGEWNVQTVPSVFIVKDGEVTDSMVGFQPRNLLEKKLLEN